MSEEGPASIRLAFIETLSRFSIRDLGIPGRAYNCLRAYRVDNVAQLISLSRDELMSIKNFGVACLKDVELCLEEAGLILRDSREERL